MSAAVRFSLIVQVTGHSTTDGHFMVPNVQVWRGQEHVETIKLGDYAQVEWPEGAALDSAETFAIAAARAVLRHLEDRLPEFLKQGPLHTLSSYEEADSATA